MEKLKVALIIVGALAVTTFPLYGFGYYFSTLKLPTDFPRTLVHQLTPSESRTIIPIQMQLPNGKWSNPISYNFDSGA